MEGPEPVTATEASTSCILGNFLYSWAVWFIAHNRLLVLAFAALASGGALGAQELPLHLRDRGTGVATSQFGTYIRDGQLLVYPFRRGH